MPSEFRLPSRRRGMAALVFLLAQTPQHRVFFVGGFRAGDRRVLLVVFAAFKNSGCLPRPRRSRSASCWLRRTSGCVEDARALAVFALLSGSARRSGCLPAAATCRAVLYYAVPSAIVGIACQAGGFSTLAFVLTSASRPRGAYSYSRGNCHTQLPGSVPSPSTCLIPSLFGARRRRRRRDLIDAPVFCSRGRSRFTVRFMEGRAWRWLTARSSRRGVRGTVVVAATSPGLRVLARRMPCWRGFATLAVRCPIARPRLRIGTDARAVWLGLRQSGGCAVRRAACSFTASVAFVIVITATVSRRRRCRAPIAKRPSWFAADRDIPSRDACISPLQKTRSPRCYYSWVLAWVRSGAMRSPRSWPSRRADALLALRRTDGGREVHRATRKRMP